MTDKSDYIKYRLKKSQQSIREARLLIENGLNDTALSRLYYAAFYAINALLVENGFNPKTHVGVKAIFNKEFVLPGKIEGKYSDFYSFLMAKRFEADYADFAFVDETKIESLFHETQNLIIAVTALLKTSL